MGEALITHLGEGRWRAFSAGSQPTGRVNPFAISTLQHHGVPTPELRSKSWDAFALPDAPKMNLVVTVCDSAASEVCPIWPGVPLKAHWGLPDPAAAVGDTALTIAFENAFQLIRRRVLAMMQIDFDTLSNAKLSTALQKIGQMQ